MVYWQKASPDGLIAQNASAAGLDGGLVEVYASLWSWRFDAEAGAWLGDGVVAIAPFPATRGLAAGAG